MSQCGSEMSRSDSGSTKAKKSIVATPAAKNEGHKIAPMRCAIGRGGWSKPGAAIARVTCEGSEGGPGTSGPQRAAPLAAAPAAPPPGACDSDHTYAP